jgi:hypothetical protein
MELNFSDPPAEPPEQPWMAPVHAAIGIQLARAKLNAPPKLEPIWPVLAAAAFAASSALGLALAIIIGLPKFG